jgi:hypothetical protein
VTLKLNKQDGVGRQEKQVKLEWKLDGEPLTVPASAQSASASRSSNVQVIIPREKLPKAAAATISVHLTIVGQQGIGEASLTVPINSPPVLKSPLEATQLGSSNSFGHASFRVSAAGIVDDDELT